MTHIYSSVLIWVLHAVGVCSVWFVFYIPESQYRKAGCSLAQSVMGQCNGLWQIAIRNTAVPTLAPPQALGTKQEIFFFVHFLFCFHLHAAFQHWFRLCKKSKPSMKWRHWQNKSALHFCFLSPPPPPIGQVYWNWEVGGGDFPCKATNLFLKRIRAKRLTWLVLLLFWYT